ncbi:hypothetical protein [Deinococcus ruber]|uniref:Uncharacterized protein n=1 Tax=Deinococcus ruber TaxID=1848197 RepID=A0A918CMF6_9DEIO|nr:hypothetical protein [Deinococcus ruber]GGR30431.1 hypothetical protein GCM10008957_46540 [Deinococcus ruber]
MDVYVDYSGHRAHAWAATIQLSNGTLVRIGGPLQKPKTKNTRWHGEEQAYLACREFLNDRPARYHNDDIHTCRRLGLTHVRRTHPLHRQAHTLARRIRRSLEQTQPKHTTHPPLTPADTYEPIRAQWRQLPGDVRGAAEKRLQKLVRQAYPRKKLKRKGRSAVQTRQFQHRFNQHAAALQELTHLTPANANEWAEAAFARPRTHAPARIPKAPQRQPTPKHATFPVRPRASVDPSLAPRHSAYKTAAWRYDGMIPPLGTRRTPPALTPTGRPKNTIRERLLRVLTTEPQPLRDIVPPLSNCSPITAIAAALQLHAEGLAIIHRTHTRPQHRQTSALNPTPHPQLSRSATARAARRERSPSATFALVAAAAISQACRRPNAPSLLRPWRRFVNPYSR